MYQGKQALGNLAFIIIVVSLFLLCGLEVVYDLDGVYGCCGWPLHGTALRQHSGQSALT